MDLSSWTSPACYIYKGLREHTTLSFFTFVEEEAQSGEVMWLSNFGITPRVSFILASTSGYKPLPPTSQLVRGRSCVSRGLLGLDSISLPAGLSHRLGGQRPEPDFWALSLGSNLPPCSSWTPRAAPQVSSRTQVSEWHRSLCPLLRPCPRECDLRPVFCPVAVWTSAIPSVVPGPMLLVACPYEDGYRKYLLRA